MDAIVNAEQVGEDVNETPKIQINLNTIREDKKLEDNSFESIHTQSRSKLAYFSQNGYLEEIFKTI